MFAIVRRTTTAALLACATPAAAVIAQAPRALPISDALGALAVTGRMPIDLSPDGQWVAFAVEDPSRRVPTGDSRYRSFSRTGAFQEAANCDIWLTNTRTGDTRNLTGGKGTNSNPVWSPDGKYLAFYSDRTGTYRLWIWERATDQMRQLTSLIPRPYFGFASVRWSGDGKRLVLKALPEGMTVAQAGDLLAEQPKPAALREPGSTVTLYEAAAVPSSAAPPRPPAGAASFPRYLADVVVVDVPSGVVHRVARRVHTIGTWISPDGKQVAYGDHAGLAMPNTQQQAYDLTVATVADGKARVVLPRANMEYGIGVSWSPDGASLAYVMSGQLAKSADAFVIPLAGGAPRRVTEGEHPSFAQSYLAPLWSADGANLYLLGAGTLWRANVAEGRATRVAQIPGHVITHVIARGNNVGRLFSPDGRTAFVTTRADRTKQVGIYRVDLTTGAAEPVFERDQYFSDPLWSTDVSDDGKTAVFVAQDAQHSENIWVTGPGFGESRQLTHINPSLEKSDFGASRVISWLSARGDTLRGALLLPAGYEEGKRYPLIVKVYAGSMLSNNAFRFGASGGGVENMQLLATRGYALLLPDVPQRQGSPMRDIADAVLPGIDKVVEMGVADPDRLGVTGHSYGGYSTLSLIVQSPRFKAAMSSAGPASLYGMYGEMVADGGAFGIGWSETGQGLMGGTPWQFHDRYIENSPITYLDKIETPLLLVQGGLDTTVPAWQADAVFTGLRRLGKEVSYARYDGEGHWQGTWGRANAIDYWTRVIGWFDMHLRAQGRAQPTIP